MLKILWRLLTRHYMEAIIAIAAKIGWEIQITQPEDNSGNPVVKWFKIVHPDYEEEALFESELYRIAKEQKKDWTEGGTKC